MPDFVEWDFDNPFGRCDLQVRRYRPVVRRRNLNDFGL